MDQLEYSNEQQPSTSTSTSTSTTTTTTTRSTRSNTRNPIIYDLPPARSAPKERATDTATGIDKTAFQHYGAIGWNKKRQLKQERVAILQKAKQEKHQASGFVDEEGDNIREIILRLNKVGYYVLSGDKDKDHRTNIQSIKDEMMTSESTENIFESVDEKVVRGKKTLKMRTVFNDRKIQDLGRHPADLNNDCAIIDDCFKENFKKVFSLLRKIVNHSGYDTIWDLDQVSYSRIMSTESSTMQQIHLDFEGDWDKFDQLQAKHRLILLSLLHFTEGGFLTVYPCESETTKEYRIKQDKMMQQGELHAVTLERTCISRTFEFGDLPRIHYQNDIVSPLLLKLEPNQTVIFRGKHFFKFKLVL